MPRAISREEANKIGVIPMGKKHPVRASIEMMEVGQLLHITKEEFQWKKHSPKRFCNEIARKTEKKFSGMKTKNKGGWVVERLK